MEKFLDILTSILHAYGWAAIALTLLSTILFGVQIYRYAIYGRITKYRLASRRKVRDNEPPISVVISLFSEDAAYLDNGLIELLQQDYEQYEVVVVYVGNDDNFYADLSYLRKGYPHLVTTQIDHSSRYPVSTKMALNVGIKAAHNEHLILTSTEALPASRHWLSLMAKGFLYGDIVIGHSGIKYEKGARNRLFRKWCFKESLDRICAALRHRPYAASAHNFGFTKSLYFGNRGFNHLNMNTGINDLFLQSILSDDNASIVITPRARCVERAPQSIKQWLTHLRKERSTRRFYNRTTHNFIDSEPIVRFSFFAATAAMLCLLPYELKIFAGALLLTRYIYASYTLWRVAMRLGERRLHIWQPLFDVAEPLMRLYIRLRQGNHKESIWR
ncbi:MAG: glycosyltransferase [Alistipes sp.]|nr:glycosyltransferase [Alistipes sp.]